MGHTCTNAMQPSNGQKSKRNTFFPFFRHDLKNTACIYSLVEEHLEVTDVVATVAGALVILEPEIETNVKPFYSEYIGCGEIINMCRNLHYLELTNCLA